MNSSNISNTSYDGGDDLNSASGAEDDLLDKNPQDVLVIPFVSNLGETVGLLSEQKVIIITVCSIIPSFINLKHRPPGSLHGNAGQHRGWNSEIESPR